MKIFSLFILQSLLAGPLQIPAAEEVMNKSRELTITGSMSAVVDLIITERNGLQRKRTISMLTKSDGSGMEKRYIKFIEPADVRGTSMLIIDNKDEADDMWIYLPALKKTRRIVATEKGRSFMNSEFSNSDMSSPPLSDFVSRHAENSGKADAWIIESLPAGDDKYREYGFSKKMTFIGKENFQIRKIEFYDFDNKIFKRIEVKAVHQLDREKYIISGMTVENLVNSRKSEISFSNIKTGIKTEDSWFTLQALEK